MASAIERRKIQVELIDPNELNPNKMGPREFDLLVDNMEQFDEATENVVVRPKPGAKGRYEVVSDHHRVEGAKFLGWEEIDCAVIVDPGFTTELAEMQMLRHNTIHGRMDPQKFIDLYAKHAGKYGDEVLQEMMGFADEAEFKKLIKQTAQSLPKEMKKKFEEAAKEIKTVDQLAKLLNTLFTKHGDTLPYAYMVVDYGGQQSLWLRATKKTMDALEVVADICIERQRTMDDLVGGILVAMAKGALKDELEAIIAKAPEVVIPGGLQTAPTKDNIAKAADLEDA